MSNSLKSTLLNIVNKVTNLDTTFIPHNTTYTVETDGSGDFTSLSDALNFIKNKYSNGNVIIQLGKGTFNLSLYSIDTCLFNFGALFIIGKSMNDSIIYNSTSDDTIRVYNPNTLVKFENLTITGPNMHTSDIWKHAILPCNAHVFCGNLNIYNHAIGVGSTNSNILFYNSINFENIGKNALNCTLGSLYVFEGTTVSIKNANTGFGCGELSQIIGRNTTCTYSNVSNRKWTNNGTIVGIP